VAYVCYLIHDKNLFRGLEGWLTYFSACARPWVQSSVLSKRVSSGDVMFMYFYYIKYIIIRIFLIDLPNSRSILKSLIITAFFQGFPISISAMLLDVSSFLFAIPFPYVVLFIISSHPFFFSF
jgi:hypothetical protein